MSGTTNAATCYMITGTWHDVELVADKGFMQLVAAKSASQVIDSDSAPDQPQELEVDYSF